MHIDRFTIARAAAVAVILSGCGAIVALMSAMVAAEGIARALADAPAMYSFVSTVMSVRLCCLLLARRGSGPGAVDVTSAVASAILVLVATWGQDTDPADPWAYAFALTQMHLVVPPLMLCVWWTNPNRGLMAPRSLPVSAVPLMGYIAYVLAIGLATGCYPYRNIDPAEVGGAQVALIAIVAVASLVSFATLICLADNCRHELARRRAIATDACTPRRGIRNAEG